MDNEWTNKKQIMHDLFVAQGRKVPVEVDGTLAGGKPRIPYVKEETEQVYFDDSPDCDFDTGPDLHLIRDMLDMVRENDEQNYNLNTERDINLDIIISPTNKDYLPQNNESSCGGTVLVISKCDTNKINKNRRRNIAITSLLEAYGDNNSQVLTELNEPVKLMKPNDFMVDNSKKETEIIHPMIELSNRLRSNPASMFRRKTDVKQEKEPEKVTELNSKNYYGQEFIPSSMADEYYQICVERTKVKQIVHENICTRAESEMKDIDGKRNVQIAHLAGRSNPEELCDIDIKKFGKIYLPEHRHLLTSGQCIVCQRLCKTEQS